jgi:hypothetical protein
LPLVRDKLETLRRRRGEQGGNGGIFGFWSEYMRIEGFRRHQKGNDASKGGYS